MKKYYCPKNKIDVFISYSLIPVLTQDNSNSTTLGIISSCSKVGKRLCQDCPLINK